MRIKSSETWIIVQEINEYKYLTSDNNRKIVLRILHKFSSIVGVHST